MSYIIKSRIKNENIGMLKKWYGLAKPNKKLFFTDVLVILFGVLCLVIAPIFAAKVIINLTENNYIIAVICLSYYYAFIISQRLVVIIKYKIYSKLVGSVYLPLQERIYEKIKKCTDVNLFKHSKEKMLHIYHEDSLTIAVFADQ
jgi:ABC-type multidrug transport system fused ATPase/permease subunit